MSLNEPKSALMNVNELRWASVILTEFRINLNKPN